MQAPQVLETAFRELPNLSREAFTLLLDPRFTEWTAPFNAQDDEELLEMFVARPLVYTAHLFRPYFEAYATPERFFESPVRVYVRPMKKDLVRALPPGPGRARAMHHLEALCPSGEEGVKFKVDYFEDPESTQKARDRFRARFPVLQEEALGIKPKLFVNAAAMVATAAAFATAAPAGVSSAALPATPPDQFTYKGKRYERVVPYYGGESRVVKSLDEDNKLVDYDALEGAGTESLAEPFVQQAYGYAEQAAAGVSYVATSASQNTQSALGTILNALDPYTVPGSVARTLERRDALQSAIAEYRRGGTNFSRAGTQAALAQIPENLVSAASILTAIPATGPVGLAALGLLHLASMNRYEGVWDALVRDVRWYAQRPTGAQAVAFASLAQDIKKVLAEGPPTGSQEEDVREVLLEIQGEAEALPVVVRWAGNTPNLLEAARAFDPQGFFYAGDSAWVLQTPVSAPPEFRERAGKLEAFLRQKFHMEIPLDPEIALRGREFVREVNAYWRTTLLQDAAKGLMASLGLGQWGGALVGLQSNQGEPLENMTAFERTLMWNVYPSLLRQNGAGFPGATPLHTAYLYAAKYSQGPYLAFLKFFGDATGASVFGFASAVNYTGVLGAGLLASVFALMRELLRGTFGFLVSRARDLLKDAPAAPVQAPAAPGPEPQKLGTETESYTQSAASGNISESAASSTTRPILAPRMETFREAQARVLSTPVDIPETDLPKLTGFSTRVLARALSALVYRENAYALGVAGAALAQGVAQYTLPMQASFLLGCFATYAVQTRLPLAQESAASLVTVRARRTQGQAQTFWKQIALSNRVYLAWLAAPLVANFVQQNDFFASAFANVGGFTAAGAFIAVKLMDAVPPRLLADLRARFPSFKVMQEELDVSNPLPVFVPHPGGEAPATTTEIEQALKVARGLAAHLRDYNAPFLETAELLLSQTVRLRSIVSRGFSAQLRALVGKAIGRTETAMTTWFSDASVIPETAKLALQSALRPQHFSNMKELLKGRVRVTGNDDWVFQLAAVQRFYLNPAFIKETVGGGFVEEPRQMGEAAFTAYRAAVELMLQTSDAFAQESLALLQFWTRIAGADAAKLADALDNVAREHVRKVQSWNARFDRGEVEAARLFGEFVAQARMEFQP